MAPAGSTWKEWRGKLGRFGPLLVGSLPPALDVHGKDIDLACRAS